MCIAKLYLCVVVFWFLCSQVVLAGGKYVLWRNFGCGCKGHLLFPGKRTDFAFWAKQHSRFFVILFFPFFHTFQLMKHISYKVALRWLPPVLHFPEPLNFTKGFLAHHDGLVPVLARWCYNSF